MAKVIGRDGVVKIGSATVAEVTGFSLDEQMSPIDNTNLNAQELEYVAGDITRTAQVDCFWDKADTTGQGAIDVGTSVTLVLQPEGNASGDQTLSMTALCTGRTIANERGSAVTRSFTFQVSGAVTVGAIV